MGKTSAKTPRVVVVYRSSDYTNLIARHGTRAQAEFFLSTRSQSIDAVWERHKAQDDALQRAQAAIPNQWRRAQVQRGDLSRFVFEPDDIVMAVGQDGLVANSAKYLGGLLVVGINPDPETYEGVLVPHPPAACGDLLADIAESRFELQERTMVEVTVDGMTLCALNEVYVGQRTHQSSRYRIAFDGYEERHSSSGVIVSTGTGATGWARSIANGLATPIELPTPTERKLAFFVREAWPSVSTQASMTQGVVPSGSCLTITSEMDADGVIFGDGIEADRIPFGWGRRAEIRCADGVLRLVL